jgi:hypothetical protein
MIATTQPAQGGQRRDPLLRTVRIALTAVMALAIIVSAALVLSTLVLLLSPGPVLEFLSRHMGHPFPSDLLYGAAGVQGLLMVSAILGFYFFRLLRRIIDTVAEGDPFIPENAVRLGQMGWIAIAVQIIAIPAGVLAGWIAYVTQVHEVSIGVSLGGVLLALILFVLARVFRKGAEMRDELEGTV